MKVLIAGGGIGGLTAALCCLHFGHDVTVLEQADAFGEVGAGIQISPNAMKIFQALGMSDAVKVRAFEPQAIEARMGESGRHIFAIPLADYALNKWGAPYLHVHRADYISALFKALSERNYQHQNNASKSLILNAKVIKYENLNPGVHVHLDDGRVLSGDVLIGADGLHSGVRAQMLGPDQPVFTGNMAWRAVVPTVALEANTPNPTASAWMGRGRHAVTYYVRGGEAVNFVGVVERDDIQSENWTQTGSVEAALQDFAGWHPTITAIISAAQPENLHQWALYDRPPLPKWTDGAVALLGDAAHPMLPFLAQGAAMAVEDAWVLARELSQITDTMAALKSYQSKRFDRTRRVQAASKANMKTFHQRSRFGQLKTYGPMWLAGRILPQIVHSRMHWLYGHDVTVRRT